MWALLAVTIVAPGTASAQVGRGTLGPIGFTTSYDERLATPQVEVADMPRIETAVEGGPAWYSGVPSVSISVYSLGSTRSGYALRVNQTDDVPSRSAHAVIPVSVTEEITNEEQLRGCASPAGGGDRWLAPSESRQGELDLPSARVQAARFC